MKPNFAINFSNDSIGLLHRTARGWLEIGATPQDAPDLAEALNYLRRSALGLAPHGVATKLIIPDDQILYLELSAPGPTDAHRDAQIRVALEGRTPYAVDDLVFDWAGEGPNVQVAVVARDTLREAEGFATEYRFNPVSFVAMPDPARFDGEPWFGPSDFAATLLQPDEMVERDSEAVIVVSREAPPRVTPAAAARAADPVPEPEPEPTALAEAPVPPPEPEPEPVAAEAEPPAEEPAAAMVAELSVLDVALPTEPEPEAEAAGLAVAPDQPDTGADTEADTEADTGAEASLDPALMSEPVTSLFPEVTESDTLLPAPQPPVPQPAEPDDEEAPYAEVMDLADEPLAPPAEPRRAPAAPLTPPTHAASAAVPRSYSLDAETAEAPPAPTPQAAAHAQGRQTNTLAAPPRAPKSSGKPARSATTGPVTAPGISGPGNRAGKSVARSARSGRVDIQAAGQTLVAPPPDAAQSNGFRMTRPAGRGRPRYLGLILTGTLLLVLAGVAAWSSITLSRNDSAEPTATASLDTPTAALPVEPPSIEDEALADGQDPAPPAQTAAELPLPTETPAAAPAATPQPQAGDTVVAAPLPPAAGQDDIVLSGMDAPPAAAGPATVAAAPGRADGLPAAPPPPPPFGTQYVFDANGLIRPTPEGIVTPEGVRLVAGRPPLVPPPRPESIAARAAAPVPETPATALPANGPTVTPEGIRVEPYTDPATQGGRPRPRPPELRTEAADAAAVSETAAAAIPPEQRMTSLVPRSRPAAIAAAFAKAEEQRRLDDEARKVAEAASLSAAAAAQELAAASQAEAAATTATTAGPVAGGIGISRLPPAKPRNFDRRVQTALAAALTPRVVPEPEPQAAPTVQETSRTVTTAEPGEDEEGAPAAAAPKIPTRASVSQQATFANAINLGRTNLIGVYGSPSRRYALIRTSSGSFKKVRVGDPIDGGTIAAITDSEVRYQKGGRLVALAMPQG